MTPHDLELRQYNDIMHRLEQIQSMMDKLYANKDTLLMGKEVEDGIYLAAVWTRDAIDAFKRYANRHYDT